MGLLSYNELCELAEQGVIREINGDQINGASIDVRLGNTIIVETCDNLNQKQYVDIQKRTNFPQKVIEIGNEYHLAPGEFILAHTMEKFYLPDNIVAEFKLKSSGARSGLDNALATWCLVGDTEIATLDGKSVKIKDLEGTDGVWVYAIDKDGGLVAAKTTGSRVTKLVSETVRITFDNNRSVECTPDHKILMRNNEYVGAGKLNVGDAVMPLNRRLDAEGREQVYCFNGIDKVNSGVHAGKWLHTHRMVAETVFGGIPKGCVVHHKDFMKYDNRPDNLEIMDAAAHIGVHSSVRNKRKVVNEAISRRASERCKRLWGDPEWAAKKRAESSALMKKANEKRWSDPEHRSAMLKYQRETAINNFLSIPVEQRVESCRLGMVKSVIKKIIDVGETVTEASYTKHKRQNFPTVATLRKYYGTFEAALSKAGYENHKIVKVETVRYQHPIPVYDLTVPKFHNFGLSCGVFAHNCDQNWHDSVLTLELRNNLRHTHIILRPGMFIGQMVFYRTEPVPHEKSYAVRGRYNKDSSVQQVKL